MVLCQQPNASSLPSAILEENQDPVRNKTPNLNSWGGGKSGSSSWAAKVVSLHWVLGWGLEKRMLEEQGTDKNSKSKPIQEQEKTTTDKRNKKQRTGRRMGEKKKKKKREEEEERRRKETVDRQAKTLRPGHLEREFEGKKKIIRQGNEGNEEKKKKTGNNNNNSNK